MSTTNVRSMTIAELQAERIVLRSDIDNTVYVDRGSPIERMWQRIETIDREVWLRQDKEEARRTTR